MVPPVIEANSPEQAAAWNELRPVLHAEVNRLPERYRIPVILSYLEGKTNDEVADLLHWPVGTVKGRLSRARDLLRTRLTRRGLALSAAFLVTALSRGTVFAEVVPAELVSKTVRLAGKFGPRSALLCSGLSQPSPAIGEPVPSQLEAYATTTRVPWKYARRAPGVLVLSLVSLSVFIGVCLALMSRAGFADIRAALSALVPVRQSGFGASCH
jgi:hypothetical protein